MRLRGVKKGIFHTRGCECVQKSMRLVSEYTSVVATSFDGSGEIVCRLTATGAGERKTPLQLSPAAYGKAGRCAVSRQQSPSHHLDLSGRNARTRPDGPVP